MVTCAHGHNRSQQVVARLRANGVAAAALTDGYDGWRAAGLPLVKRHVQGVTLGGPPTTWVTGRRPKIDRVACPWLIARFLDPTAEFLFVEPDQGSWRLRRMREARQERHNWPRAASEKAA